jgi:hypothetical protein
LGGGASSNRVAAVRFIAEKGYALMTQAGDTSMATMDRDEINNWIRWQQCRVILGMVAEYLCMAFVPLAIIVWIVVHYVRL